jgi:hypothetical protein
MAVGYTQRHTERFAREAIRTEQSPVVSQTAPDDVMDDARDAARLELACVKTWVKEEDTRESVRATTRFPHNGEVVLKPDVLETGIDIRTVTVMSTDDESSLGEATLAIAQMWPTVEAMVHTANRRYKRMDNTLRPEQRLGEGMSLEEATLWIRCFDSYLTWNDSVIDGKSLECVRNLLETQLDASLISKLARRVHYKNNCCPGPGGHIEQTGGVLHREFPTNSEQKQQWGPTRIPDNHKFIQPCPSNLDFPGVLKASSYTSGEDQAIDLPLD